MCDMCDMQTEIWRCKSCGFQGDESSFFDDWDEVLDIPFFWCPDCESRDLETVLIEG